MLTSLSSPTAPLDSGKRRIEARHRRREATAPYPSSNRVKKEEEEGEEEEDEYFGRGTRGGGFFARLASYIPIVNKLMKEEDTEDAGRQPANESFDDIQTTQEDVEEEEEEEEEEETEKEKEMPLVEKTETQQSPKSHVEAVEIEKEQSPEDDAMPDAPASPVTRAVPCFVTQKKQLTTPPRHPVNKKKSRNSRSPSHESGAESGERSPAMTRSQRKRGDKRVFLPGPSQQSKMLRISGSQRRRKSSSPSPHDSALAVIKQKKTITLEEFERLQHQLHEMVETTPQTQLATTQAALANGLEHPFTRGFPGPTSFPGYVPGSIANQDHGALVVQDERKRRSEYGSKTDVLFGKRPRNRANEPNLFSGTALRGYLTREERLMRKPRPSRLLTGTKRDASARNAYSAAVAEKILSTLNKVQTPLEREAHKPAPSTSMSWAKYHLSLVDDQKKSIGNGKEIDSDDIAPPTTTVPRVVFPQPSEKPCTQLVDSKPKAAFDTPSKSADTVLNGVNSFFSPQVVSMTPAPTAKTSTPDQPRSQTIGEFKFTLPLLVEGAKQSNVDDEDTRVRFEFSPPPSMCEPPVKVSAQKTALKANGGAAPFDFMPSSPKAKTTEWVSKPLEAKKPEKPKANVEKPVVAEKTEKLNSSVASATTSASSNGAVNPLARFMQLKPGQWKCPGCSVLNEGTSAKCPCCEAAKPGGGVVKKASPVVPKAPETTSSSGLSFGIAAVDTKKDAGKTTLGSITEGGFSFGAPVVESGKNAAKAAGSISSSGFSFGAPAADATKNVDKAISEATSGGFKFTAPVSTSEKPAAADFGFGTTAALDAKTDDSSASTAPISFEFSSPLKKTGNALPNTSGLIRKATSTPPFSFGVPAASAAAPEQAPMTSSVSSGFSFGATSASTGDGSIDKRKAPETVSSTKNSAPSFSFGVSTTSKTEVAKTNNASGFSFGVVSEPKEANSKELEHPKKRLAGSIAAPDSKPDASAFTLDAASKPPQVPVKEPAKAPVSTPLVSLSGSGNPTTTEKPKETTSPAFSLGASSSGKASVSAESKPKETVPSQTGFTFGSSPKAAPKPTAGSGPSTESKTPAFSFGVSAASPASASSAEAMSNSTSSSASFTFGQNTTPITSSAPAFGAAPSTPAFSFGASTPTPPPSGTPTSSAAQASSASASAPAFTFGSSSAQPAGSSTFGQAPVSTSSFGSTSSAFGSTSNTFGSSSSSGFGSGSNAGFVNTFATGPSATFGNSATLTPSAPAFSFGAASQAPVASTPAPTATQPAFSFGASSAPSPGGFGAAPANGFGSSSAFGAAPGGFRSSSPASTLGNSSAPAFGSSLPPPTTTFGTPAFGAPAASGFSSGPPSSGFRTPSPTPAFGAPQAAPAFGTAPNAAFGATAPAPGFGAPGAGAFGAPVDGGFNMGAAPQHAKGRRILKAKTRSRRTS